MNIFRKCLLLSLLPCFLLCTSFEAQALNENRRSELVDSFRRCLPRLTTSADSISTLYNILDLTSVADRGSVAWELRDVAHRSGNKTVELDMYRALARTYSENAEMLDSLLSEVGAMSLTTDQRDTYALIRITRAMLSAEKETPDQRMESIRHLVDEYHEITDKVDIFRQVTLLFIICDYISYETGGELLEKYTKMLDEKINLLPPSSRNLLRNSYLAMVAMHYTDNQFHAKAVAADRKLLQLIAESDAQYTKHRRRYKNNNEVHFQVLCRMLTNYEALSDSDIANYHNQYLRLVSNDPSLHKFTSRELRTKAYYQMATHHYVAAIALLHEVTNDESLNLNRRVYAYQQMRKAARAIGDEATLNFASVHYADLLEQQHDRRSGESSRELEIIYNMQRYNDERTAEAIEASNSNLRQRQREVIFLGTAIVVVVVLLLLSLYVYRRLRARNKRHRKYLKQFRHENFDLRKEVESQRHEIASMKKDLNQSRDVVALVNRRIVPELLDVANNAQMLVDNAEAAGEKKDYLQRFSSAIVANIAHIHKIAADIATEHEEKG